MCRFEFPTNRRRHSTSITSHLEQNAMSCALDAIWIPVGCACNVKLHIRCNFNEEMFTRIKLICECQLKQQMPTMHTRFPYTIHFALHNYSCDAVAAAALEWNASTEFCKSIARATLYTESANYCISSLVRCRPNVKLAYKVEE